MWLKPVNLCNWCSLVTKESFCPGEALLHFLIFYVRMAGSHCFSCFFKCKLSAFCLVSQTIFLINLLCCEIFGKISSLLYKLLHLRSGVVCESLGLLLLDFCCCSWVEGVCGNSCGAGWLPGRLSGKRSTAVDIDSVPAPSKPAALCHMELLSTDSGASATEEHKFNEIESK